MTNASKIRAALVASGAIKPTTRPIASLDAIRARKLENPRTARAVAILNRRLA